MSPEGAERELLQMLEPLCLESFYISGTWADEHWGVYVGWVSHRGSFSDPMTLRSELGDVKLVFYGEEFAEPATARRLKEKGHALKREGPSYLIHLYEEDPAFLASLNGRFQGILADRNLETSTLFNDRYGMHRIYYHQSKEAFYFAAEAKAILSACPELRRADPRGIGEFIACGCVLENRTLFKGIHILPPGSAWVFRNGSIQRRGAYFDPSEWENQEPLDPETYYRELRTVFSQNLPCYFNGHQPFAMAFT